MNGNRGKNNSSTGLGIGLLSLGIIISLVAVMTNTAGALGFAAIMVAAGLLTVIFSALGKTKNTDNQSKPHYPPGDDKDPYAQYDSEDAGGRGYNSNPWQNRSNPVSWQSYGKPDDNRPYKQNGPETGTDEAAKAEEKARIQKEREAERQRRIAEASSEVQKHYPSPKKDKFPNIPQGYAGGFADKAAPEAAEEEEEVLFDLEWDDDGRSPAESAYRQAESGGELENLGFGAEAERQNLAILQSCGPMETGRITAAESVSENYCRITFAVQTFKGAEERAAVVKKDAKYAPGTAHYILLDSGDKERCTVL